MSEPVRVVPAEPIRTTCAVIRLAEGAHEITLHIGGKSLTVVAESAVVIANTEHRQAAHRTKP